MNFTLAHELAHIVLKHELHNNTESEWQTLEADRFAAALLMPKHEFNFIPRNKLSEHFFVSNAAVYMRMKDLAYLRRKGWPSFQTSSGSMEMFFQTECDFYF